MDVAGTTKGMGDNAVSTATVNPVTSPPPPSRFEGMYDTGIVKDRVWFKDLQNRMLVQSGLEGWLTSCDQHMKAVLGYLPNLPGLAGMLTSDGVYQMLKDMASPALNAVTGSAPFTMYKEICNVIQLMLKCMADLMTALLKSIAAVLQTIINTIAKLLGILDRLIQLVFRCGRDMIEQLRRYLSSFKTKPIDFSGMVDLMAACPCIMIMVAKMFNCEKAVYRRSNREDAQNVMNCILDRCPGIDFTFLNDFFNSIAAKVNAILGDVESLLRNLLQRVKDTILWPFRQALRIYCGFLMNRLIPVPIIVEALECLFTWLPQCDIYNGPNGFSKRVTKVKVPVLGNVVCAKLSVLEVISTLQGLAGCINAICPDSTDYAKDEALRAKSGAMADIKKWNNSFAMDMVSVAFSNGMMSKSDIPSWGSSTGKDGFDATVRRLSGKSGRYPEINTDAFKGTIFTPSFWSGPNDIWNKIKECLGIGVDDERNDIYGFKLTTIINGVNSTSRHLQGDYVSVSRTTGSTWYLQPTGGISQDLTSPELNFRMPGMNLTLSDRPLTAGDFRYTVWADRDGNGFKPYNDYASGERVVIDEELLPSEWEMWHIGRTPAAPNEAYFAELGIADRTRPSLAFAMPAYDIYLSVKPFNTQEPAIATETPATVPVTNPPSLPNAGHLPLTERGERDFAKMANVIGYAKANVNVAYNGRMDDLMEASKHYLKSDDLIDTLKPIYDGVAYPSNIEDIPNTPLSLYPYRDEPWDGNPQPKALSKTEFNQLSKIGRINPTRNRAMFEPLRVTDTQTAPGKLAASYASVFENISASPEVDYMGLISQLTPAMAEDMAKVAAWQKKVWKAEQILYKPKAA